MLVEKLQPQVEQLADVLSVELAGDRNYVEVLTTAHEQMSSLTEEMAGQFRHHRSEDEVYTELLTRSPGVDARHAIVSAKENSSATRSPSADPQWNQWHAPHERTQGERAAAETGGDDASASSRCSSDLSAAVPLCRARRQELSLLLGGIELCRTCWRRPTRMRRRSCGRRSSRSCRTYGNGELDVLSITAVQLAAILPDCERREAVAIANEVLAELARLGRTRRCAARGPHVDAQRGRGDGRGRAQELRPLAARRKCRTLPLRRPLVQHQRGEEH